MGCFIPNPFFNLYVPNRKVMKIYIKSLVCSSLQYRKSNSFRPKDTYFLNTSCISQIVFKFLIQPLSCKPLDRQQLHRYLFLLVGTTVGFYYLCLFSNEWSKTFRIYVYVSISTVKDVCRRGLN